VTEPAVGSYWQPVDGPGRVVVAVEPGRVRWVRPGQSGGRWVSLDGWGRWCRVNKPAMLPELPADNPPQSLKKKSKRAPPPTEGPVLREMELGGPWSGIMVPVELPARGARVGTVWHEWGRVVSEARGRGLTLGEIAKATGLPLHTTQALNKETRGRYDALTPAIVATRRERLWWDAHRVQVEALRRLEGVDEARDASALLKVAIEAQKRQAALIGADMGAEAAGAQTTINVAQVAVVDPVALAAKQFGVDVSQLAELGDGLAGALTVQARVELEADDE
jgi:hypothetical protein